MINVKHGGMKWVNPSLISKHFLPFQFVNKIYELKNTKMNKFLNLIDFYQIPISLITQVSQNKNITNIQLTDSEILKQNLEKKYSDYEKFFTDKIKNTNKPSTQQIYDLYKKQATDYKNFYQYDYNSVKTYIDESINKLILVDNLYFILNSTNKLNNIVSNYTSEDNILLIDGMNVFFSTDFLSYIQSHIIYQLQTSTKFYKEWGELFKLITNAFYYNDFQFVHNINNIKILVKYIIKNEIFRGYKLIFFLQGSENKMFKINDCLIIFATTMVRNQTNSFKKIINRKNNPIIEKNELDDYLLIFFYTFLKNTFPRNKSNIFILSQDNYRWITNLKENLLIYLNRKICTFNINISINSPYNLKINKINLLLQRPSPSKDLRFITNIDGYPTDRHYLSGPYNQMLYDTFERDRITKKFNNNVFNEIITPENKILMSKPEGNILHEKIKQDKLRKEIENKKENIKRRIIEMQAKRNLNRQSRINLNKPNNQPNNQNSAGTKRKPE